MAENNFKNETEFVFSSEFVGFTTIPNFIFNDRSISFKAVGIYCQILQFQNSASHKIYIKSLQALKKDGRESVAAGLNELIDAGYLTREQLKSENGRMNGVRYTVYMKPCISIVSADNGKPDNGGSDNGKPGTYNTNKGKKKIPKKENTTAPVVIPPDNVIALQIERDTKLSLTDHQVKKVAKWESDTATRAIRIFKNLNGLYFTLLDKIYTEGAVESLVAPKLNKFNDIPTRDNIDYDDLEKQESARIDKILRDQGRLYT